MAKYDFLVTDWKRLRNEVTDQSIRIEQPLIQKVVPENSILIDLINHELFKIGHKKVSDCLISRRSKRKGSDKPLTLEELSYLLFMTNGIKNESRPMFRTVPSAGARHAFETYIQVEKVEGIEKGLYRYLPLTNQLLFIKKGDIDDVTAGFLGQNFNGGVAFLWTAIPYRMEWRYKTEALKLILIDVGHVCQNLYIACESINLGTCAIGAYDQELLDTYLQLDTEKELVIYNAIVVK